VIGLAEEPDLPARLQGSKAITGPPIGAPEMVRSPLAVCLPAVGAVGRVGLAAAREIMTTPVSWLQITPGWSVVGSDGEVVGTVLSIVGDKSRDIFNGLAIGVGGSSAARYVEAEIVASIDPGQVALGLTIAEAGRLELFEEPPPVTVWRPSAPSLTTRISNWLRGRR
jgi:hypothetical protein